MSAIHLITHIHAPRQRCVGRSRRVGLDPCGTKHAHEHMADSCRSGLFEWGKEVEWNAIQSGVRQRLRVRMPEMMRRISLWTRWCATCAMSIASGRKVRSV